MLPRDRNWATLVVGGVLRSLALATVASFPDSAVGSMALLPEGISHPPLIELILVMRLPAEQTKRLSWSLGLASALMVALGDPGEIQDNLLVRWFWWASAMVPFCFVVFQLVVGLNEATSKQASSTASALVSSARYLVVASWLTYPFVCIIMNVGLAGPVATMYVDLRGSGRVKFLQDAKRQVTLCVVCPHAGWPTSGPRPGRHHFAKLLLDALEADQKDARHVGTLSSLKEGFSLLNPDDDKTDLAASVVEKDEMLKKLVGLRLAYKAPPGK